MVTFYGSPTMEPRCGSIQRSLVNKTLSNEAMWTSRCTGAIRVRAIISAGPGLIEGVTDWREAEAKQSFAGGRAQTELEDEGSGVKRHKSGIRRFGAPVGRTGGRGSVR